jgi:hypothetical protein
MFVALVLLRQAWRQPDPTLSVRSSFVATGDVDKVSCAPLGLSGDGIPDGVVSVDVHRMGRSLGMLDKFIGGAARVDSLTLLRDNPGGVWETTGGRYILGVSSAPGTPLANAPDGSIRVAGKGLVRLWAFFCRAGLDTRETTYRLRIGGQTFAVDGYPSGQVEVRAAVVLAGRARFAKDVRADRVSCRLGGRTGDGQDDGVVKIDLESQAGGGAAPSQEGRVHDIRLERSNPFGVWRTGTANYLLGVASDATGPLLNAGDGSVDVAVGRPVQLWAFFCRDNHDTVESKYHLVVEGRPFPVEGYEVPPRSERQPVGLAVRASFVRDVPLDLVSCQSLGRTGDGKFDGVVAIELKRQSGSESARERSDQPVPVREMRLERSNPSGIWHTGPGNYLLGITSKRQGPLINAPNGGLDLAVREPVRLWAFFCRDGHDTADSKYHLLVADRRIPIESRSAAR